MRSILLFISTCIFLVTLANGQWYWPFRRSSTGDYFNRHFPALFKHRQDRNHQRNDDYPSNRGFNRDGRKETFDSDESGPLPTMHVEMAKFAWPKGVIPYKISHPSEKVKRNFQYAIDHIMKRTCIRFTPWAGERDYVNLVDGRGCSSHVGRQGGAQKLTIGRGCSPKGTIIHELIHAVGFFHLQQKHDRDNHLKVHWSNIAPGKEHNFNLLPAHDKRVDKKFDYNSVMIYSSEAFSKGDGKKTMEPKERGITLLAPYDKLQMTRSDAVSINRLYKCSKVSRG